jgi:hypothetical protein
MQSRKHPRFFVRVSSDYTASNRVPTPFGTTGITAEDAYLCHDDTQLVYMFRRPADRRSYFSVQADPRLNLSIIDVKFAGMALGDSCQILFCD